MSVKRIATATLVALTIFAFASNASAGKPVFVGVNVPANNRIAIENIKHATWDALLKKYVDARGDVNYRAWRQSTADIQQLDAYLAHLSRADTSRRAPRAAGLAYWINAYNAVTVKGILREYPTTSIRNHTAKLYGYNIWKDLQLRVGGRGFALEYIEHEILRKAKEPRIHFAIVCASRSCPQLINQAYTADNIDRLLASNTRAFFAKSSNFRYDARGGRFHLSSIMRWFATDFGADSAAQLRWISQHVSDPAAGRAAAAGRGSIAYLSYDWGLNDQATAKTARR
ncbi:MAG: DUF547 domain-containing protein [Pirellulaceae bacterium]|jgi:hypothetical protein|nr:DUF547 domain-containing protein [Pirellulaceae bacterium]